MDSSLSAPAQARPSPLIVGVSGHRDIRPDSAEPVRRQVIAFFHALRAILPNTELRVTIGMAQGADLLVAQAAVDCGLALDAVLPMPLAQYIQRFAETDVALLRALLSRPGVRCVELPAPPAATLAAYGDAAHYAQLTDVLVRRSNLLLALWDGRECARPGGTADTVVKFLGAQAGAGRKTGLAFTDDLAHAGGSLQYAYWVHAPREGQPDDPRATSCYLSGVGEGLLARHADMPGDLHQQLAALERYNHEYADLAAAGLAAPHSLLDDAVRAAAPEDALPELEGMDREYGKADALAMRFQRRSNRLFLGLSYLAALSGFASATYTTVDVGRGVLVAYVACLTASVLVYRWFTTRGWFTRHLTYRALAETMRIRFFLRLAAADREVDASRLFRLMGIDQFPGFGWIAGVIEGTEPFSIPAHPDEAAHAARIAAVRKAWVEDQRRYFHSRVARMERADARLKRLKSGLFAFLFVLVLVMLAARPALDAAHVTGEWTLTDGIMFLMALFPLWLGIWELYANKMATRELLWQYRNQLGHFSRAELRLAQAGSAGRQEQVLAEVGRNSLMECYLWAIHRYHREHEPPTIS